MKMLWWFLAAGATAAVVLQSKRAKANAEKAPTRQLQVFPWPPEYRRAKTAEVTAAGTAKAREVVFGPSKFGDVVPFTDGGREYAIVVEEHWHRPGGPVKPWGIHKGATLLVKG